MLPQTLDVIFPYLCFGYGAVMTLVLNLNVLNRIADERMPADLIAQWRSHRGLAMVCLIVGAAWILQNLWLA